MAKQPLYDRIGVSYSQTRREEPRIAARIHHALGDARSVVNVGAGAGAYEPRDREVIAVEPSSVMIAQRPPGAARAIQARAEALPLRDDSVDAAMAVLSDHHWEDRRRGLREMRRVARGRVVLFTYEPAMADSFWFVRDYLPGFYHLASMSIEEIAATLGDARVEPVPIPHDCADGFFVAFWRRPHAYLDERVRAGTSVFARVPEEQCEEAIERLRADLESGAWEERNGHLLELDELDLGFRLVTAE
jgi:SAM-dependent methyltransferase